jgi:HEPN domain-containing protein
VQAIGTIEDAMSYVEAARILDESTRSRYHNYWPPVFFLLAHAIELVLKAYLYSAGTRDKDLKAFDVRHNLTRLLEKAEAAGFRPAHESFAEAVEWLAPYHQDHRFRYRQPGLISLPKPDLLAQIVSDTGEPLRQLIRERYFAAAQASEHARQDRSGD